MHIDKDNTTEVDLAAVVVSRDNCWPYFTAQPLEVAVRSGGKKPASVKVGREQYNRWVKAMREFTAVQEEMRQFYEVNH